MPVATPYNPDGTPVLRKGSTKPQRFERHSEARALASAVKAWWQKRPVEGRPAEEPPLGSRIHMDGEPAFELRRMPVIDPETDEVTATRLEWVDLRLEARAAEEAKALEEAKAAHAARKAARAAAAKPGEQP